MKKGLFYNNSIPFYNIYKLYCLDYVLRTSIDLRKENGFPQKSENSTALMTSGNIFLHLRVTEAWNKLPASVVDCQDTASFKTSMLPVIHQHYAPPQVGWLVGFYGMSTHWVILCWIHFYLWTQFFFYEQFFTNSQVLLLRPPQVQNNLPGLALVERG